MTARIFKSVFEVSGKRLPSVLFGMNPLDTNPAQWEMEHDQKLDYSQIPLLRSYDGKTWECVGQWERTQRGEWKIHWTKEDR